MRDRAMHYCGHEDQGPDPMLDPCPGCVIESLRAENMELRSLLTLAKEARATGEEKT
jgi:hypothetical protein